MPHIRAVIVADGEVDSIALRAVLVAGAGETVLAIGADGGTRHLEAAGRQPYLVCGDADSLSAEDLRRLRERGTPLDLHPTDKDESDTELCVRAALRRGATQITILGALGGARVEHGTANQLLLAGALLDGVDALILHAGSTLRRVGTRGGPGTAEIVGAPADFVSLLPLDDPVSGITTHGLRFALRTESLPLGSTRGLSNELIRDQASVTTTSGRLLVIHTPRPAAGGTHEGASR